MFVWFNKIVIIKLCLERGEPHLNSDQKESKLLDFDWPSPIVCGRGVSSLLSIIVIAGIRYSSDTT